METKGLRYTRGDTFSFTLTLTDIDTSSINNIFFTAKKNPTDSIFVFQKTLADGITDEGEGVYIVRVAPEDTCKVPAGVYVYDLELDIGNDVYTVIKGPLTLVQDVTTH